MAADRLSTSFPTVFVHVQASVHTGVGGAQMGRFQLDHPQGTTTWMMDNLGPPTISFQGGPGDYEISLTRVGSGWLTPLPGVIVGVDPVESLDEVV